MMKTSPRTVSLLLAGCALLTSLVCLSARGAQESKKEAGEDKQGFFIDVVDVSVVDLDVFVTDKKGNPVTGLTKDDFEVFENRREMTITNFYPVVDGKVARKEAVPPPADPSPTVADEVPPVAPQQEADQLPAKQRLSLVVYIDNFNIRPFQRNRVMRELRAFLRKHVQKGDRVALVTYDRSLHLRQPFTSNPAVISRGLQELETVSGQGVHAVSERRDALERIEESTTEQEGLSFARIYAGSIFNDIQFTISALRDYVDGLAGVPGRKMILYVSEGLPMRAGEDLFYAVQEKFKTTGGGLTQIYDFDASRKFQALAAAANANRVSFYTIDAGGLRVYGADVSERTPNNGIHVDQIHTTNVQSSLQYLAERTGGKAIINTNRVTPALEKIAQDFRTYYSLGYTPSHHGDGRYYRIEVKVKGRKGLRVRHRDGYRDKPPAVRAADSVLSGLIHKIDDNPIAIDLEFGRPTAANRGNYTMPLSVSIPLKNIALVPSGAETYEARLTVFVAVQDEEGGTSEVRNVELPISIPAAQIEAARAQSYLYKLDLLMRQGAHRVAIGLRDQVGAEFSLITRSVQVGGP